MSYLLDTNVLSELRRKAPNPAVVAWFANRPATTLYISVLTIGELRKGVETLTDTSRRLALLDWLETDLPHFFIGRVLPVDLAVADRWGRLVVPRRHSDPRSAHRPAAGARHAAVAARLSAAPARTVPADALMP